MNEITALEYALSPRMSRELRTVTPLAGSGLAADVAPKAPGLVLLASLVIPGLGQFINGNRRIALAFFAAFLIAWQLVPFAIGIPMLLAVVVWSTLDAWADAKSWNLELGFDRR